jgi:hypothetical protein
MSSWLSAPFHDAFKALLIVLGITPKNNDSG